MNGDYRRFGALSSSADPAKLAATVTGLIKAAAGLAALLGYSFIVGDITELSEQAGQLVLMGFSIWGAAETCFGLLRKIVVAVARR